MEPELEVARNSINHVNHCFKLAPKIHALAADYIKPLKRVEGINVSHILFADDMLVFCKDNETLTRYLNVRLEQLLQAF